MNAKQVYLSRTKSLTAKCLECTPHASMKPKEKVPMTVRAMVTAESSTLPMCPTNILVTELVPY